MSDTPVLKCKVSELRLADTIELMDGPFGSAVVMQIADGFVEVFRPYAVTADFSYTGGVVPYVGIETVKLALDSSAEFRVFTRKELR